MTLVELALFLSGMIFGIFFAFICVYLDLVNE